MLRPPGRYQHTNQKRHIGASTSMGGYHEGRRRSKDTCPELYSTKNTSMQRYVHRCHRTSVDAPLRAKSPGASLCEINARIVRCVGGEGRFNAATLSLCISIQQNFLSLCVAECAHETCKRARLRGRSEFQAAVERIWHTQASRDSEYGTYKTVKARFWPWL